MGGRMKAYPSIVRFPCEFRAHVWDKLDGSNLRFEWNKKRGWHKFGTRHRLFDETDIQFGKAIGAFNETLSDPLSKICSKNRWESAVVFAEWHGPNSFAGNHCDDDLMKLTVFDVAPYKQGFLRPTEFRKTFEGVVDTPKYLGEYNWTKGFLERVLNNDIPGITFEGVVGKAESKGQAIMAKAKTSQWLDKLKLKHPDNWEQLS